MCDLEQANILIVEDETIVAWDIQEHLERLGYYISAKATSGEAAIAVVSQVQPDLVLMDIQLQGRMDGIEAAKILYDQFNIPVIYLTAHSDAQTLSAATHTNPFGYLLKPFQSRELHTTIQIALQRHRQEMLAKLRFLEQILDKTVKFEQLNVYLRLLAQLLDEKILPQSPSQRLDWILKQLSQVLNYDYAWIALYDKEAGIAKISHESDNLERLQSNQIGSIVGTTIEMAEFSDFYQLLFLGVNWIDPPRSILPHPYLPLLRFNTKLLICPLLAKQVAGQPPEIFGEVGILITDKAPWKNSLQVKLIAQMVSYAASLSRQAELVAMVQAQKIDLERLNYLKEDFISSVSHVLKTPLDNMNQAIKMTQYLVQTLEPLAVGSSHFRHEQNQIKLRLIHYLEVLEQEWQIEHSFIGDLLNLKSPAAVIEPVELSLFEVQSCCMEIVHDLSEPMSRFDLSFSCEIQPEELALYSHRSSFQRIIKELLNNAVKYTPPNQEIYLVAVSVEEQFELRITNTGVTIPELELESIFQPFYRIPRSNPWDYCGTGLGLALVRKLVTRLGGEIGVESANRSTTFILKLPQLQEA